MFNSKPEKRGFFEAFSSKTSFFMGLILGILVICTAGFFILLSGKVDLGTANTQVANTNVNSQAAQPVNQGASNLKKITKNDHVRGDLNAPVMLVEFSDYQCSFCAQVHPTLKKLVADYNGQVAWAYKHFPIDSRHPYARQAAEAAECANDQDKFWEYSDALYDNQSSISSDYLSELAGDLGLNLSKFNDCLNSGKYQNLVNDNYQEGLAAGITGTPGVYVNDQLVKGALPYDSFKQLIDTLLAK